MDNLFLIQMFRFIHKSHISIVRDIFPTHGPSKEDNKWNNQRIAGLHNDVVCCRMVYTYRINLPI